MDEYIEREALILAFNLTAERSGDPECPWDMSAIETEIEAMPAADVVPVVHGRWVNEQMIVGGFAETWACDCSVCGRVQREPLWKPNFCPNCGARMDGGSDV